VFRQFVLLCRLLDLYDRELLIPDAEAAERLSPAAGSDQRSGRHDGL
jgi:hypothetical protein